MTTPMTFTGNPDIFYPDQKNKGMLHQATHVAIVAHADDIEIGCYPAIEECLGQGDKHLVGAVMTNGRGCPTTGPFADLCEAQMIEIRRQEQREAAKMGQYLAVLQFPYESSEVADPRSGAAYDDIKTLLQLTRPQHLFTHVPVDGHPTHIAVLIRVIEAIRSLPKELRPDTLVGMEVWRGIDWVSDEAGKVRFPVNDPDLMNELVGLFQSQIEGGKRYDRASEGRRLDRATFDNPHAIDSASQLMVGIDMTPLIKDDRLSVAAFAEGLIEQFRVEVTDRIYRVENLRIAA